MTNIGEFRSRPPDFHVAATSTPGQQSKAIARIENGNAFDSFQYQQVPVAGREGVAFSRERGGENKIVIRIAADRFRQGSCLYDFRIGAHGAD